MTRTSQAYTRNPKPAESAPLPNHSIYWTSTAVLLWDGIDPKVLRFVALEEVEDLFGRFDLINE